MKTLLTKLICGCIEQFAQGLAPAFGARRFGAIIRRYLGSFGSLGVDVMSPVTIALVSDQAESTQE